MSSIREALAAASQSIDRSDARILLAFVLQCRKEALIAHSEDDLSAKHLAHFSALAKQAADGVPIPYLTGTQAFWKYDFFVNENVLIPRPDTEILIEKVIELFDSHAPLSLLDLGTGSGCIAVTIAKELPQAAVTAVDTSSEALAVAQLNAKKLGASNIVFRQGSWYEPLEPEARFDVIASNPPYIAPGDSHLPRLKYEPVNALTDGIDGLSCLRSVIKGAKAHLKNGGLLVVEHGFDQANAVRGIFQDAGFATPETGKDLGGNDRITFARNA